MKAVWVTRSFLDYRIPVYEEVSKSFDDHFVLFFNADYVPDRCRAKSEKVLGDRARGLRGELAIKFGAQNGFANKGLRIPYQPGLVKTILEEKPDILISDGFFQWTYSAIWLRATKKIPHIMCYERTAHTERKAQGYRNAYRRFVMRWIDAICCSGKLCGEYVQSLGYPAEKITYGHMVSDTAGLENAVTKVKDKYTSELKTKYDLKGTVFLYVGRIIPRKGLIQLLNAWKEFCGDISTNRATLLLVGDGPQRRECESFCSRSSLANVIFTGIIDYDSLAPYYKVADAFIIPTLEDNWSLVVPEAMACGLPIICSKYNGCWPELVRPGENGWIFNPLDCKGIVRCLKVCTENRDRLPQMGERSKVIVRDHTPVKAAGSILHAWRIAVTGRR